MTSSLVGHSAAKKHLPDGVSFGWAIAGAVFILALFSEGYRSDLGYWTNWMGQLQSGGYREVSANYPPLLLHWLWLGAQVLDGLAVGRVSVELVKWWTVFPVWIAWMVLIYQVADSLERSGTRPRDSWIFWLTVLNPAIIAGGPQWGQVDLLPWVPLSFGLLAHQRGRHILGPIFFVIAVAIKFQAVVYAPVFFGLYLRALGVDRRLLWAIPGALLALFCCFLPFSLVGRAGEQAAHAYWENIGGQPAASNNAANLWKLVGVGDLVASTPLFAHPQAAWLTPQIGGLLLFSLGAGLIFFRSFTKGEGVWGLAVASNFCFFTFCPEMHERYLFGAVPAAALWAAQDRTKARWYVLATALVALNISFIYFPRSQYEWLVLSGVIVAAAVVVFLESIGVRLRYNALSRADRYPALSMACFGLVPLFLLIVQARLHKGVELSALKVGDSMALVDIVPIKIEQEWEAPQYQGSPGRTNFAFSDGAVSSGIKVHARSELSFHLPNGRFNLSGRCGPELVADSISEMRFTVFRQKERMWQSEVTRGTSSSMPFDLSLHGPADVTFAVDPLGSNYGDHGLWGDVQVRRLE